MGLLFSCYRSDCSEYTIYNRCEKCRGFGRIHYPGRIDDNYFTWSDSYECKSCFGLGYITSYVKCR